MVLVFGLLLTILCFILICAYLKVFYKCIKKVHIKNVENIFTKKKTTTNNVENSNEIAEKEYKQNNEYQIFKQAPGPLPWPILGNLHLLGKYKVPFEGFTDLAKQFGDVYSLTLGTTRCLIVNNLDLMKEVLNENGKYFGGRPDFLRFHVLFGGDRNNSLALCDWSVLQQKRRNLARKHCSPRDASSYFQKMSDVGCMEMELLMEHLNQKIKNNIDIALKPFIQQACANMFSQYMCSLRFDYDDSEFQMIVRCFDEIFWEINQGYAVDFLPWLKPFYTKHMKKIVFWSESIRTFILERIISVRECKIDIEEPEKDFTDALLKSLLQDDEVSRDTIIYMLEDFIGGHSAIGNLVMLALGYTVLNPHVAENIQKEIDNLIEDTNRNITLQDVGKMPYTLATIYEVLRYSSSPIVPHVATEDVSIAGYGVTKGTIVFINNYEINTSSKYWDKPEIFNPERFMEPLEVSAHTNNTKGLFQLKRNIPHFLPFSIGKRTCIGQNLVKGFGFLTLANILKTYTVSCTDKSKIKMYPACVAVPPDTFSLILTPRQKYTT